MNCNLSFSWIGIAIYVHLLIGRYIDSTIHLELQVIHDANHQGNFRAYGFLKIPSNAFNVVNPATRTAQKLWKANGRTHPEISSGWSYNDNLFSQGLWVFCWWKMFINCILIFNTFHTYILEKNSLRKFHFNFWSWYICHLLSQRHLNENDFNLHPCPALPNLSFGLI